MMAAALSAAVPAFAEEVAGYKVASCPPALLDTSDKQSKYMLVGAEIWSDFLALQEPSDAPTGYFSDWQTTPEGAWELRCKYQSGREIIVELPQEQMSCQSGRLTKSSPYQAGCSGAALTPAAPPDHVHVIAPLDRNASLKGIRIGQTVKQVSDVAVRLNGAISFADAPNGLTAQISLGPKEHLSIHFNKDGYVQEVEWIIPDDSLRAAVLQFGFFDTIGNEKQTALWSRSSGILIKAHWASVEESGDSIRLLRR